MAFVKEFYPDELYSLFASQMILEKGVPVYPSGILRVVGGFLLYLQAPVLAIFGYEEGWVRLLRVLISTGGIIILYKFATKLFSKKIALLACFLVAIDIDMITWGGIYTKPYSVIPTIVILLLWLLRQVAINPNLKQFVIVSLLLVILVWINPLCILLMPAFGLAYLVWLKQFHLKPFLIAAAIFGIGLAGIYISIKKGDPGLASAGDKVQSGTFNFSLEQLVTGLKSIFTSFYPDIFTQHYYRTIMFVPYLVVIIGVAGFVINNRLKDIRINQEVRDVLAIIVFLSVSVFAHQVFKYYHFSYMTYAIPFFYLIGSFGLLKIIDGEWKFFNNNGEKGVHYISLPNKKTQLSLANVILAAIVLIIFAVGLKHYFENLKNTDWLKPYHYVKEHWQPGDAILNSNAATYIFAAGEDPVYYFYTEKKGIGVYKKDSVLVDRFMNGIWIGDSLSLTEVIEKHDRIWFIKNGSLNTIKHHYPTTLQIVEKKLTLKYQDNNNNAVYIKDLKNND